MIQPVRELWQWNADFWQRLHGRGRRFVGQIITPQDDTNRALWAWACARIEEETH